MVLLYTVRSSDKRASRLVLVDEWKGLGGGRGGVGGLGGEGGRTWRRVTKNSREKYG